MDRRQLEYFLAIVDHHGFTNAAHVLHIAQPSLSQAIKTLERELDATLFYRLSHGVRLTPAGEALVGPARQAMRSFDAAEAAVVNVADLQTGKLEIVALPALAADPLAQIVGTFQARYPGIVVRLLDPRGSDVLDVVRSGEAEVAFTWSAQAGPDLEIVRWGREEIFLAMPPGHMFDGEGPLPIALVSQARLIVATATRHLLIELLAEHGVTPRIVIETDHREAIVPLVLAGAGGALLPPSSAAHARSLGASVRRLDPSLLRQLMLAHRRAPLSPAAAAFVEIAVDALCAVGEPEPVIAH